MFVPVLLSAYFLELMQKLRTHISKVVITSLLWAGLGLYIAQPVQATNSSRTFAHWLDEVAEQSDDLLFEQELIRMNNSGSNAYQLMEYLARHIQQDDRYPANDELAAKKLYHMLLVEWSHYQTGNGMSKVPPPTFKSNMALQVEKYSSTTLPGVFVHAFPHPSYLLENENTVERIIDYSLTPMSEGIAIGAP